MSTAPAVQRRPLPAGRGQQRPRLRVVPPRRVRPAKTPFVLLVLGLLAVGLIALLSLNTALARDSFTRQQLETRSQELAEREQALRQELARLQSPAVLAQRAAEFGMVPGGNPAFLDTRDGSVLGEPTKATAPPTPPAVQPPAVQPPAGTPTSPAAPAVLQPATRPQGGATR
ncbi:cell division protein FtsL [Carbonactinospora thermoautotrophica]|uniref:cell division protein FtsL n=1 Tax=Carbonactinospora thermoautotrophica TaxID=1469144 RepID=UPI00227035CE|nr:cell division protein FtsL [Carbonactinospora thermoautotrophica]MCX9190767.1 cell division protein FtsL [Carbonactinospora thermoautotrophica]